MSELDPRSLWQEQPLDSISDRALSDAGHDSVSSWERPLCRPGGRPELGDDDPGFPDAFRELFVLGWERAGDPGADHGDGAPALVEGFGVGGGVDPFGEA